MNSKKSLLICLFFISAVIGNLSFAIRHDLPIREIGGKKCYYYETAEGDDIFKISEKLGLTRSQIVEYNSAAADGVRPGLVLYFPIEIFEEENTPINNRETFEYVDLKKEGKGSESLGTEAHSDLEFIEDENVAIAAKKPLNVTFFFPFELNETTPSRGAEHATEFYKGFLLGIDSLRASYDNPHINIYAIDCGPNDSKIDFRNKALAPLDSADIIIAPESLEKLLKLGDYAKANKKYLFNVFQTRDTTYLFNPYMLQGNIPSSSMYEKAIKWFITNLDGRTPVFLEREAGKKDKQQFVDLLRKKLSEAGIKYLTLTFQEALTQSELEKQLTQNNRGYVFVPLSGELREIQKISSAIVGFKSKFEELPQSNGKVSLFGYPEFIRFTGDSLDKLKKIDTYFYSRFSNNLNSPRIQEVGTSYMDRFGSELPGGVPNQALFGFDVAKWILRLAGMNEVSAESIADVKNVEGVQTAYNFIKSPAGGFYNGALLMVNLNNNEDNGIEILW